MDARGPVKSAQSEWESLRAGAVAVVKTLRERGFAALWAGGCVRDMVLGKVPKDYDVATDATPDQVIACFARSVPVGAAFGVVRVLLPSESLPEVQHEYEVATFRADLHYEDGRRPTGVRWAHAREDALRRDFTINGMFFDPLPGDGETSPPDAASAALGGRGDLAIPTLPLGGSGGRANGAAGGLIDYVGGREDLERCVVRAIGDPIARFSEDYLRLLRCVRFAARLRFAIDPATWDATVALAPKVAQVSAERIFDELTRILGQGHAERGIELLATSGLLVAVLPEVAAPPMVERARERLARAPTASDVGAWGALLYELPAETVQAIALRLKSSRAFQKTLVEATAAAHRLVAWPDLTLAERKRLVRQAAFGVALEVAHAAGTPVAEPHHALLNWPEAELRPPPLVDGGVLTRAGFAPGPGFKVALDAVEEAQLDGRAKSVDDALAIVRSVLAGAPSRPR